MPETQPMRAIDKALAILQRSNDGNDLSRRDLRILELGVNGQLNQHGEEALEEVYQAVVAGTYRPQWFHDIEHMLQDHEGYVTWKGRKVEHYSYDDVDAERAAALDLAQICRSLEERCLPVTSSTVSRFSPFSDAPKGTPWVQAMLKAYTCKVDPRDPGVVSWVIFHVQDGDAIAVNARSGQPAVLFEPETPGALGSYTLYHRLDAMGMENCSGQLQSYGGFVQAMEQAGLTPVLVDELLARRYVAERIAA